METLSVLSGTVPRLSKRLNAVYQFARSDGGLADIGTDHGYIPITAAIDGRNCRIISSDIRSGPLRVAKENAKKYGVDAKIEFQQSAGLESLDLSGISTVIIAGMGGDTIREILLQGQQKLRFVTRMILQPQSKYQFARNTAAEMGFTLSAAALVYENRKYYEIYLYEKSGRKESADSFPYCESLLEKGTEESNEYLRYLIRKHSKISDAAGSATDQHSFSDNEEILNRLKETAKINSLKIE